MPDVTVKQLAELIKRPVAQLLEHFQSAGVPIDNEEQLVSESQKRQLLLYLKNLHGTPTDAPEAKRTKITLTRQKISNLKVSSAPQGVRGSAAAAAPKRTVKVTVRKRRTHDVGADGHIIEPTIEPEKIADPAASSVPNRASEGAETAGMKEVTIVSHPSDSVVQSNDPKARGAAVAPGAEVVPGFPATPEEAAAHAKRAKRGESEGDETEAAKKAKKRLQPKDNTPKLTRKDMIKVVETEVPEEEGGLPPHLYNIEPAKPKEIKTKRALKGTSLINKHGFERPQAQVRREIAIPETLTVAELASQMTLKASILIKTLMKMGVMATINQSLDQDTAVLAAEELGYAFKLIRSDSLEASLAESSDSEEKARPPVVTIMGHVDHGKTSLLDFIRSTQVAAREAGGITQHIGAYHVETGRGMITFLDTPGHEAFTAMRARGAQCTDLVILVVAADDGVMPQTVEAITHAKAAGIPIIVAVNKIDKHGVDPERIKTELMKHEVVAEEWGGDAMFVNLSAKTGEGVDKLLETVLLQAEMLELKAPVEGPMQGTVIESRLDKGRGPVATLLVQRGTLKKGDILLAGVEMGRVRSMQDEYGHVLETAGPSMPVEVIGLSGVPGAGDPVHTVESEQKAREISQFRVNKQRQAELVLQQAASQDLLSRLGVAESKTLNIVLKADVQGSVEAIRDVITRISTSEIQVRVVSSGLGGINISDVNLALASQAILIGFNVRADATARDLVERNKVPLNYYSIIYDVVDEVKKIVHGMLDPIYKEQILGLAEVRDVFHSSKFGAVAGCMVTEGSVKRNKPIRVLRDNVVIYEGELESLRRFKDDASEVRQGMECGIAVKNYNDVRAGDQIEVFERVKVERTL